MATEVDVMIEFMILDSAATSQIFMRFGNQSYMIIVIFGHCHSINKTGKGAQSGPQR